MDLQCYYLLHPDTCSSSGLVHLPKYVCLRIHIIMILYVQGEEAMLHPSLMVNSNLLNVWHEE